MHSEVLSLVIFFAVGTICGAQVDATESSNSGTDTTERNARWSANKDSQLSGLIGYYSPSETSIQHHEESSDETKLSLPTSFDDFVPHKSGSKKSRYSYAQRNPSKSVSGYQVYKVKPQSWTDNSWKGYSDEIDYPSTWAFKPSDIVQMVSAIKHIDSENKPTGLFSKLTAEPVALFLVFTLPLAVLLASTLPVFLKGLFGGMMGIPTVTTVADGNGGRNPKNEGHSLFSSIMETIDGFDEKYWQGPSCLKRSFCEATQNGEVMEFRYFQKHAPKIVSFFGDYWLVKLGLNELMKAINNINCENIYCSSKTGKESLVK